MERILGDPYPEDWLIENVEREKEAFEEEKVEMVVTGYNGPCCISVRAAGLPLVYVPVGTFIPPFFEAGHGTFPEIFENPVTNLVLRLFPDSLKNKLINWMMLHIGYKTKTFNKVAKRYGIAPFKRMLDLVKGDYNLVSDTLEFLKVEPTEEFPRENFVGPIPPPSLLKEDEEVQSRIDNHLKRSGRSIFLSMGTSGKKSIFLKVIDALNYTDYNVIAAYTSILDKGELPEVGENILLEKFVPSVERMHKAVDLSIIHGGENTVHVVSYSGKPVIGIPMWLEQQYNLDALVGHGVGFRLPKYPPKKELLKRIEEIFENYEKYLNNAQTLAETLPAPHGDRNAAKRLLEIATSRTISDH